MLSNRPILKASVLKPARNPVNTGSLVRVVLKVTGKVFKEGCEELISNVASLVKERVSKGDRVAIVTGGGSLARAYVRMGSKLELSDAWLDLLGIEASRLNAFLLASALGDLAYLPIPRSVDEILKAWAAGKVVICGGLQPGQSTNAVAAAIAELTKADLLINATNVDGVYEKDPRKYPGQKPLKELSISELKKILESQSYLPGHYELLDLVALRIVERAGVTLVFVNVFKPETIRRAWSLDRSVGTWVTPRAGGGLI